MNRRAFLGVLARGAAVCCTLSAGARAAPATPRMQAMPTILLPAPRTQSAYALERALRERRSSRHFARAPLTLQEVAQLLWAAQGVTHGQGLRSAPSAGALYPLQAYFVAFHVSGLAPGVYRYVPQRHELNLIVHGDVRAQLAAAALGQSAVAEAPGVLVLAAVEARSTGKYGARGIAYVEREAGHAAQNVLLQATALQLAGVPVGAFDDARVAAALGLAADERPLYLVPLGRP